MSGRLVSGDDEGVGAVPFGGHGVLLSGDSGNHLAAVGVGLIADPVALAERVVDDRDLFLKQHLGVLAVAREIERDVGGKGTVR